MFLINVAVAELRSLQSSEEEPKGAKQDAEKMQEATSTDV